MVNVILKDVDWNKNYYLKLSEEQYNLLEWLNRKELLADVKIEAFEGVCIKGNVSKRMC